MKRLILTIAFPLLLGAQTPVTINGIPNQVEVGPAATYDTHNFLAYYTMEEGSGSALIDHSGHGNNAAQAGTVTWSTDGGNTFANSSSNHWTLPAAVTPSTLRTFLIAVKYSWQGSTHCQTSAVLGTTATVLFWVGYGYDVNAGTSCGLNMILSSGPGASFQTPGNGIHVLGVNLDTVTGANNVVYIDGRKEASPSNVNPFPGGSATMLLGANLYPGAGSFPGTIYSAAFGTGALTDAQMMAASQTMLANLAARGVALNQPVITDTNSYVLLVGDSLTAGGGPNCCNGTTIADYISLSQTANIMSMGVTGSTLVQMSEEIAGLAPRRSLGLYNVMVIWGGTNDCTAGATPAQALQSYAGAARTARAAGWKVVIASMTDRPGSCGTTFKDAFNTLLRAQWPQFADAFADLGADSHIGVDGTNTNTTYFSTDNLHLTSTGYQTAAGIFSTAINGLLSVTAGWVPSPTTTTLGGVESKDCSAGGQFLQKINTDGTETCGTPAGGGNVSGPGTVTNGYLAAWGASNNLLTAGLAVSTVAAANTVPEAGAGGTLAAGWLPSAGSHTVTTTAPLSGGGAVALGGTLTLSCPTCLTANVVPSVFGRTGAVIPQSGDYSAAQISGLASSATTDTTNAANIASGTLAGARLPVPGAASLGGVQSKDCTSGGQFLQKINTDGTETCGTPAGGGNVSGPGAVTNGYLAAWGASNNLLTAGLAVSTVAAANTVPEAGVGGTLAAGWLPSAGTHTVATTAPLIGGGAVALGGTLTLSCPTCLTANAVPSVFGRTGAVTPQSGDYSAAQISGLAPSATTDTTNAANIASGTLPAARLPVPGAASLGGVQSKDCTSGGQFLQKINTDGTETCGTPAGGGGGGGLNDTGANGIVARTSLNTTTARAITGGTGITVANGDGVAGAPLVSLDTTVGVTQAQVQNLTPLVCNAALYSGYQYNCAMSPAPANFVDINNNPLAMNFCPATTPAGGPLSVNQGLGAKRVLLYGYDPPLNAFRAGACYLLFYNPGLTVDGVASVGAFELRSLTGISPFLHVANAATTGTLLYQLTKLTGAPSTAVVAGTSDTGGIVGITVADAGTTLTAVIQTNGNASCVFDGATTAGHYVQISGTLAGDCHDSGASYPTSGQVLGRVLSTNAVAGTYTAQLFGAEVQAAAAGPGSGTVTSVATSGPISGGAITASGTISCPTCVTGGSLTSGQLLKGAGSQGLQTADLTGDVTTAGGIATTIAANAVTSAKMAVVNTMRTCVVVLGANNGAALATGDIQPQGSQCDLSSAATAVQVTVMADAGASTVSLGYRHSGSTTAITPVLTPAAVGGVTDKVACANTAGTAVTIEGSTVTCSALTNTALAAGDWVETVGGTADGTSKRLSISLRYTVN